MHHDTHDTILRTQQLKNKQRLKARLRKIFMVLACVVVFCTTYALILPALTSSNKAYCGFEEHLHTRDCYSRAMVLTMTLDCEEHLAVPHTHSDKCRDAGGNLICGRAEFYAHSHGARCYNREGELVCKMQERTTHVHSSACYAPLAPAETHSHHEDCYRTLICTLSEGGHSHGEACFRQTETLTCTMEEGHSHSETCYETTLSCGEVESDTHSHTAHCYTPGETLLCTVEEGHAHDPSCYLRELVCTLEEQEGHSHTEECYSYSEELLCTENAVDGFQTPQAQAVICGQLEAPIHEHGESCFRIPEQVLTCKLSEDSNHSHTELCYGRWNIGCGRVEHIHSLACYSNPEADLESEEDWLESMEAVRFTGQWPKDTVAIAVSQLGYTESENNYFVTERGTMKGYSRYGQWYGDPYGDWCAMFASFCMEYAGVENVPIHSNCGRWIEDLSAADVDLYREPQHYRPLPGDLIFFDWNGDGSCEHVGLVAEVSYGEDQHTLTQIKTIEGNSSNRVRYMTYDPKDPVILGYGDLNRAYERYRETNEIERTYDKGGLSVNVLLNKDSGIPDEAELVVHEVKAEEDRDLYDQVYVSTHDLLAREISKELPPVIQDLRVFDISFQMDGRRITPLSEIRVRMSYSGEGDLYRDYPVYVTHHGSAETALTVGQSASAEEDRITVEFRTQEMDLFAVTAVDLQSQSYMSRTDVSSENMDEISGFYALVSGQYALVLDGLEPVSRKLETQMIDGREWILKDASLELWNLIPVEEFSYYIDTEIDGEIYHLSMENEEGNSPKLYLTQKEEERTLWTADPNDPEVGFMGNGAYLQIEPKGNTRAKVEEPTIGLYRANEFQALFDGQFGAHYYYNGEKVKYDGATRTVVNCNAQNQVTLLTGLDNTGVYPFKVVGWYDIVNKVYYGQDKLGTTITLNKDIILYPDYVAETYDIGQNVDVVKDQPRLTFIDTHIFDYNELFNVRGAHYTGNVPNITDRSASWNFNTWTVNSSGFNFVLSDWIHGTTQNSSNVRDGNIGRPLELGIINSVHNHSREDDDYNAANMPHFVGGIVPGIMNEEIRSALFSHDDYMGRHYIGKGDMLYQYDQEHGFYYYNSALNAASYNRSAQRFYVYDYTSGVKNDYSRHDFLPFNYGKSGTDKYDDVGSEVNFWFGMTSEISFYLPDEVGSPENVDENGVDLQFRFSGDDDVWVFFDDQLVMDVGGVHDIAYGEINFATGKVKTAGYDWENEGNYAYNSASVQDNLMPGIDGTRGKITTTELPHLEPGEIHTLTVCYIERGSSLSNCAIYFNLAPMYELELVKRDAENQRLLEGAVFQIFKDPECTQLAKLMHIDETGYVTHPTEFTTDESGVILCSGLVAGHTYYVKETKPPNRTEDQLEYPDMSKYIIEVSLGTTGNPTVLILNSDNEEWVYADAYRYSDNGTRISLTVYNQVDIGGDAMLYAEKFWEEEDTREHEPITVRLLSNGKPTSRTLTLSAENGWKGFFYQLPEKDSQGNDITYSVREINPPPGYKVSYKYIGHTSTNTTINYSWEPVTFLEGGGRYIFVRDGNALTTSGTGSNIAMNVSASQALTEDAGTQPYVWTATASGNGFYLRSGGGGYLNFNYSMMGSTFRQTTNASTTSVMNITSTGKLYGMRNNTRYYFTGISGNYGSANSRENNGVSFTVYRWTETITEEIIENDGWQIVNTPIEETVAIPVRKEWDANVSEDRWVPVDIDLYLAPDDGGQATLISSLTLTEEKGWADIFQGLVKPEEGYHYYVTERTGGFVTTYNGPTVEIQVGTERTDTVIAMPTNPVDEETARKLWKTATRAAPTVDPETGLYFGFGTDENPAGDWRETRQTAGGGRPEGSAVQLYTYNGYLIATHVYNSITMIEYIKDTGYTVKPRDHFEISLYKSGGEFDPAELILRITVDGTLHEIPLGMVQPASNQTQTFVSEELGLSGRVTTIGIFVEGHELYADELYIDYMYLGTGDGEDQTETTEPTEATEPSQEPTDPSEDPTVPDILYNDVTITNRLETMDIPVEKVWQGVNPDIMKPIVLCLYLVEEGTGENGLVSQTVTQVKEESISKDEDWKGAFTEILLPRENEYYVVSEKDLAGYQVFYNAETLKITPTDGIPITGVRVELQDGKPIAIKVTNLLATELPSTGGSGTNLYTMGGAMLALFAAILLVYNRKENRRKEERAS